MPVFFKDLDSGRLFGKTIILDIDGTLTADGGNEIGQEVKRKLQELAKANHIFLLTNKHSLKRNSALAEMLNLPLLNSRFRKPNPRVVESIPSQFRTDYVVIGDKFLTDGLLARALRCPYIKTKRMTAATDTFLTKCIYLADDFFYLILGKLI